MPGLHSTSSSSKVNKTMKPFLLSLLLIPTLHAFSYGLKPVKVSKEIYCFFGAAEAMDKKNNGNMVNSCFVDMQTSWIVIDSGPSYLYAKEAYSKIQSIKKQPVSYVVNTHVHDDHWLGNGFYKHLGATIVGSVNFTKAIDLHKKTRMQNRISKEAFKGTIPTLPERYISSTTNITVGGKNVQLIHLEHKAHTQGDIIIYIPAYHALFAGDLVFNDRLPSLRDGSINFWLKSLEQIKTMPLTYIIPGHGTHYSSKALEPTLHYLKDLKSAIVKALDRGMDLQDALESLPLNAYKKYKMYKSLHRQNLQTAFQQLEWGDE